MRQLKNSRFMLAALVAMSACSIEAAGTASAENPAGAGAPRQPVEYIAREKSLVGNEMFEAGQRVFYAGLPAENLEPTCDIGRARYQEYLESNKYRVAKMISDNRPDSEHGISNPQQFMQALLEQREADRRELAEQLAEQSRNQAEAIGAAVGNAMAAAFAAFFPNGSPSAPAAPAVAETPAASPAADTTTVPSGDSAPAADPINTLTKRPKA